MQCRSFSDLCLCRHWRSPGAAEGPGGPEGSLQWAGRTNDINEAQRLRNEGQLTDVYTGGRQDNFHAPPSSAL